MVAQVASNVFGAHVVGTCSTSKMQNVPLPPAQVVDYTKSVEDLEARLKALTTKKDGFNVVFDGVGKSTYTTSLNVCRPRGLVVYFGNASGPVPAIDPLTLSGKGSLFMTRPKLNDYIATQEELGERAGDVFAWMRSGKLSVQIDKEFKGLEAVDEAINFVKNGRAKGKVVVSLEPEGKM
jgi:NADPH2:quinone reductase